PSLWNTPEFYFYYVIFCIVVPYMCYTAYELGSTSYPGYKDYEKHLSEGWMFGKGRKLDNSDAQYANFRDHIPTLTAGMLIFVITSRVFTTFLCPSPPLASAWYPVLSRLRFNLAFSIVALYVVFGNSLIFILGIALSNYVLTLLLAKSVSAPLLTWVFNLGIMFLNDRYHGYNFEHISEHLAFLEKNRGLMHRWYVTFNIVVLRMISYAMDYYWMLDSQYEQAQKNQQTEQTEGGSAVHVEVAPPRTEKERISNSVAVFDYNLVNYLAYLLYLPLYLAGPIITFNNFVSQMRYPVVIPLATRVRYGIRLVMIVLLMEFMQHTLYVVALSKEKAWGGMTPFQISMIGFFNLKFIWMKLMIIWRFFRFWAMLDGVDTTENMVRCMSNNYSAQSFWRDWHCSFNKWLIRYVYIPVGGKHNPIVSILLTFTFVAVWHDISLNLLAWAWLICLFLLPEGIATFVFNRPRFNKRSGFRHLCAVGAVFNIFMMMVANLVGFAVGLEGIKEMLEQIMTLSGATFIATTFFCLFVGAQLMFEVRESEYR
ncbi:MBOAT-domain-containing protein, partial [Ramicandelaber brevisporus]